MQYTQAQICLDFVSEVLTAYQINVTACQPCDLSVQRPAKQTSAKYMLCIVSLTCRLTLMLDVQAAQLWLHYVSLLAGVNQSNQPNSFLLQMVLMAKIEFATDFGGLPIDCLLPSHHNTAVQRILVHLAVPVLVLYAMVLIQVIW